MTVLDLIIQLEKLPKNMEVLLDVSHESSRGFHFKEIAFIGQVETDVIPEKLVVISQFDLMQDEEEEENYNLN